MGLPSQLDGSANGLKLDRPKICPHCLNAIEYYRIVVSEGRKVTVCPMCGKEINIVKK